jgi:hypothetical protein
MPKVETTPKELAIQTVKDLLDLNLREAHNKLRVNRAEINHLAWQQKQIKKQIAELYKLRNTLYTQI